MTERERVEYDVALNVYDLVPRANRWGLDRLGLGAYHSGVEIDGFEYFFAQGAGVCRIAPRSLTACEPSSMTIASRLLYV